MSDISVTIVCTSARKAKVEEILSTLIDGGRLTVSLDWTVVKEKDVVILPTLNSWGIPSGLAAETISGLLSYKIEPYAKEQIALLYFGEQVEGSSFLIPWRSQVETLKNDKTDFKEPKYICWSCISRTNVQPFPSDYVYTALWSAFAQIFSFNKKTTDKLKLKTVLMPDLSMNLPNEEQINISLNQTLLVLKSWLEGDKVVVTDMVNGLRRHAKIIDSEIDLPIDPSTPSFHDEIIHYQRWIEIVEGTSRVDAYRMVSKLLSRLSVESLNSTDIIQNTCGFSGPLVAVTTGILKLPDNTKIQDLKLISKIGVTESSVVYKGLWKRMSVIVKAYGDYDERLLERQIVFLDMSHPTKNNKFTPLKHNTLLKSVSVILDPTDRPKLKKKPSQESITTKRTKLLDMPDNLKPQKLPSIRTLSQGNNDNQKPPSVRKKPTLIKSTAQSNIELPPQIAKIRKERHSSLGEKNGISKLTSNSLGDLETVLLEARKSKGNDPSPRKSPSTETRLLLIIPAARIDRYIEYLEDLTGKTSAHNDFKKAHKCLEYMKELEVLYRHTENTEKLKDMEKKYFIGQFQSFQFVDKNRYFIKEGSMLKQCRKEKQVRGFFLFNDILIYAHPQAGKYNLPKILFLEATSLVDVSDRPTDTMHSFIIKARGKSFQVFANNQKEKLMWMTILNNTITQWKELNKTKNNIESQKLEPNNKTSESAPVWVPDDYVVSCPLCKTKFTMIHRRHHCRMCGDVVCGNCSRKKMIVPAVSALRPVRVCDKCHRIHTLIPSFVEKKEVGVDVVITTDETTSTSSKGENSKAKSCDEDRTLLSDTISNHKNKKRSKSSSSALENNITPVGFIEK